MNKVFVELIVPVMEQKYDVYLPVNKKVLDIIILLNKAINEMTEGYFPINNKLSLIDAETGVAYNTKMTLKDCKILNGTTVVLA